MCIAAICLSELLFLSGHGNQLISLLAFSVECSPLIHPQYFGRFHQCSEIMIYNSYLCSVSKLFLMKVSIIRMIRWYDRYRTVVPNLIEHPSHLVSSKKLQETSFAVQWLRLCTSSAGGGVSSIPGQGAKILHAVDHDQKTNKEKNPDSEPHF